MNVALQNYREYGDFIKEIKAERNQVIMNSLKNSISRTGSKIGTFKKNKIDKFKKEVSSYLINLDLKAKEVFAMTEEKMVNAQIVVIDKYNRFKNNAVQLYKTTSDKIGSYKKTKIVDFKKKISFIVRDIDLSVKNIAMKVEKKGFEAQIEVINKANRFKSSIIQFSNTTKNKVGSVARSAKNKITGFFKSDEVIRQNKLNEINERKKKIAELKEIRNQLLMGNYQNMNPELASSGRSRGVLYVWLAAVVSVLLMGVLIGVNIIKG